MTPSLPSVYDVAPLGARQAAAHVASLEHAAVAGRLLTERLARDPSAVVAVDLEGLLRAVRPKIDLIQVAIDATETEPALIYVFNIHRDRRILHGIEGRAITPGNPGRASDKDPSLLQGRRRRTLRRVWNPAQKCSR